MTVTYFSAHRRLELKSDPRENNSHPCAQRTLHPFCVVSHACIMWITRSAWSRSKIILGNTRRSTKHPGDRMQRLGLPNPRHISPNGSRAGWTKKRQTVAKLIEKFESHKYKEQFLQDMSQTQKINRFSDASQKLLKDMNQTEIFELEVGSFIADADEIWSTIELRKRFAWRPRISFIRGKTWFSDRVWFSKLIRNVINKIYLYKKQDHLWNRNKMRRATVKPEATLLTTEYLVYRSQRWNCRMHCDKIRSQSWLRCLKNNSIRNNSLET